MIRNSRPTSRRRIVRQCCGNAALLLLITSCATAPVNPPRVRVGEIPALGAVAEVRVGEPLYSKFNYRIQNAWRLLDPFERPFRWCMGCHISVPVGATLQARSADELCTSERYVTAAVGPGNVVCFTRGPKDGEVVKFRVPGALPGTLDLDKPLRLEEVEVMAGEGFKAELIYQGRADSVLRLLYREFSEHLARPAFQQELTYTIAPGGPTEIVFRGLTLEVHDAGNTSIRYRLIKGL